MRFAQLLWRFNGLVITHRAALYKCVIVSQCDSTKEKRDRIATERRLDLHRCLDDFPSTNGWWTEELLQRDRTCLASHRGMDFAGRQGWREREGCQENKGKEPSGCLRC